MDFDPLAFRDFLCREFLKESKDMLNRCLACGQAHKPKGPEARLRSVYNIPIVLGGTTYINSIVYPTTYISMVCTTVTIIHFTICMQ